MPATILLAISLSNFIWLVVALFIMFTALSGVVLSLTWLERKLLGRLQLRLGPTRTGPMGESHRMPIPAPLRAVYSSYLLKELPASRNIAAFQLPVRGKSYSTLVAARCLPPRVLPSTSVGPSDWNA